MNGKILSILSVCLAAVAAGVSAIVVTNNRANQARARAAAAESRADEAAAVAKKAKSEEASARALADEAEAKRLTAVEERKAQEAALQTAKVAESTAKAEAEAAKARADEARAKQRAANDVKTAEKAKLEQARAASDRARAEAAKAEAEAQKEADALAREKVKAEAKIAEAKNLADWQRKLEDFQRQLVEIKADLDERERALRPEATIYNSSNIQWVAEREADVIGADSNQLQRVKRKVAPEDDFTLPRETRRLARADRLRREALADCSLYVSNRFIRSLERLYAEALRDDRVVEAESCRKAILSLYPGWEPSPDLLSAEKEPAKKEHTEK